MASLRASCRFAARHDLAWLVTARLVLARLGPAQRGKATQGKVTFTWENGYVIREESDFVD